MSVRVMIAIWLGCVLAGAGSSSGVLAGDAFGDRSLRSPTICPSGIFVDPATLPRTDVPTQPGSIQTQRGEVLYSRADPAIQTMLTQCEQEVANCERRAEGYCKTPMINVGCAFGSSDLRPLARWHRAGFRRYCLGNSERLIGSVRRECTDHSSCLARSICVVS